MHGEIFQIRFQMVSIANPYKICTPYNAERHFSERCNCKISLTSETEIDFGMPRNELNNKRKNILKENMWKKGLKTKSVFHSVTIFITGVCIRWNKIKSPFPTVTILYYFTQNIQGIGHLILSSGA